MKYHDDYSVSVYVYRAPDIAPALGGHHLTQRLHEAVHGVVPVRHHGLDAEYDSHARLFGRSHAHCRDYYQRRAHFHRNKALIQSHNTDDGRGFTLEMNHLGDWSDEEYQVMLQVRA